MATYASSIKTNMKQRLLRIATVPLSLHKLLDGQMNYLQQRGWEVHSCSAFGPEIEAIKSKGIIFHEVAMTRQITPWRDLLSLIALVRLMNKIRPTIVHTYTQSWFIRNACLRFCQDPSSIAYSSRYAAYGSYRCSCNYPSDD